MWSCLPFRLSHFIPVIEFFKIFFLIHFIDFFKRFCYFRNNNVNFDRNWSNECPYCRQRDTYTVRLFINFGTDPLADPSQIEQPVGPRVGQQNGEPRREYIIPFPWPYIRGNTQVRLEVNNNHLIVRFSRRLVNNTFFFL